MIRLAMLQIILSGPVCFPQGHVILLWRWWPLVGFGMNYNCHPHCHIYIFFLLKPNAIYCDEQESIRHWGSWVNQSSIEYNLHLQKLVDYPLLCTITGWLESHPRSISNYFYISYLWLAGWLALERGIFDSVVYRGKEQVVHACFMNLFFVDLGQKMYKRLRNKARCSGVYV